MRSSASSPASSPISPAAGRRARLRRAHRREADGEIAGIGRFATDAKLARLAGSAPIPPAQDAPTATASTPTANRQLNCALHRLAINKGRLDPEPAAYLARKQADGKSRREALRCLKRHLARRVWHLLQPPPPPQPPSPPRPRIAIHCHTPYSRFSLT